MVYSLDGLIDPFEKKVYIYRPDATGRMPE